MIVEKSALSFKLITEEPNEMHKIFHIIICNQLILNHLSR